MTTYKTRSLMRLSFYFDEIIFKGHIFRVKNIVADAFTAPTMEEGVWFSVLHSMTCTLFSHWGPNESRIWSLVSSLDFRLFFLLNISPFKKKIIYFLNFNFIFFFEIPFNYSACILMCAENEARRRIREPLNVDNYFPNFHIRPL